MESTEPSPQTEEEQQPQSFRIVLLVALLTVLVGLASVYPIHIPISYYESDFLDYCVGIEALDDIKLKAPSKRSNLAALMPYWMSKPLGIINGLAVSSILCTLAIIAIALRWVQELRPGTMSLWSTAVIALAMGPLMSLVKIINFYPQVVLATFVGSWWVYRALRRTTFGNVFWAGCSVPLVFMIDVRGLVWGVWFALLLLPVTALGVKRLGVKVLPALLAPLWVGWQIGRWSYHRLHSPLSRQLDTRPLYNKIDPNNPLYQPPHEQPDGFLWGRSSLQDFTEEISFLIDQAVLATPPEFYQFSAVSSSVQWYWSVLGSILIASILWLAFQRRKKSLLAVVVLLPFFFTFWKLPDVVEPHIRFYAQCLPGFLVVISVAIRDVLLRVPRWGQATALASILAASMLFVPYWGVSRVMLNAHVEMAIPEAEEINTQNELIRGYEVHLYVSPSTKQEKMLERNWLTICNNRIADDGVIVPFYQRLKSAQ
jgi:hypothetical protein